MQVVNGIENKTCDAVIFTVGHQEFTDLSVRISWRCLKMPKFVLGDLKSLFPKSELEKSGLGVFRF